MPEVRAVYHFYDEVACKNRYKGDVFQVTEERADKLVERGLVIRAEDLFAMNDIKRIEKERISGGTDETKHSEKPEHPPKTPKAKKNK